MPFSRSSLRDSVVHADVENGRHLPLVLAMAHEIAVAATAECQRKAVEQDGFAGAGLAGQHRKPGLEGKIQPLDQYDIADR